MTEIVEMIRQRNEKGLSLLYDRYAPTLLGIIVGVVKRRDIGEEVLQQSLLKAWNHIDKFNEEKASFFTWLMTIARRTAIDQARLVGNRIVAGPMEVPETADDSAAKGASDGMDADRLLRVLDHDQRAVLDMIYLQGHTHRDTAEILQIPLGTVKSRLRLGIAALRKELQSEKKLFLGFLMTLIMVLLIRSLWI